MLETNVDVTHEESAKLHRFFLDHIEDGAFLVENATIMDVSTVGTEIFGYSREELIGQAPTFIVSPRSTETVRRKVAEGDEVPYECEGLRKDGSTFPLRVKGRELTYEGRKVRLTTVRDISERKQAEVTLRKLSRAVEQSPSVIFITNTDGTIEYVNTSFTEVTGYSAEEAIGENPRILKSGNTPRETYADLWKTIRSGHVWRAEIQDQCKDGSTFWAHASIAPVKDDDNKITHFIATHEDITRRKKAELEVQSALEKADIANRAKSELLANMSHGLRTPLNAIIGFSDTIKSEVLGPIGNEKYKEYINDIAGSGQHLLELINDILDVSAIEVGRLDLREDRVEIKNLVNVAVRFIQHRADQGSVHLHVDINDDLPWLYADERRMKQILLNLLSNAVKFTPAEGTVSLRAYANDDDELIISVIDTGIGMDEKEMAKAMTQFGQVDRGNIAKHEGTGLGLPLTKGLVELHQGTLDITSDKSVGTKVTVKFPKERIVSSA